MKIKAKLEKFKNFNAMNVPCSGLEFSKLRRGHSVKVDDEVGDKMLSMGIVEKTTETKKKSKGEK